MPSEGGHPLRGPFASSAMDGLKRSLRWVECGTRCAGAATVVPKLGCKLLAGGIPGVSRRSFGQRIYD